MLLWAYVSFFRFNYIGREGWGLKKYGKESRAVLRIFAFLIKSFVLVRAKFKRLNTESIEALKDLLFPTPHVLRNMRSVLTV